MTEYFIRANSFAAPFFSDESREFIDAATAELALEKFATEYKHPCGLYSAVAYTDANAFEKGEKPLAKWLCNHEIAKMEATKDLSGYSYLGDRPGRFRVNDDWHEIESPKEGRVITHDPSNA